MNTAFDWLSRDNLLVYLLDVFPEHIALKHGASGPISLLSSTSRLTTSGCGTHTGQPSLKDKQMLNRDM